MRQAVRGGRQILLPRIRSQGKTGIQGWQRYPAQRLGGWRPKTLDLPFQTLRYSGMAARGVLSSLPFSLINLDKGPSSAAMDVELARLPATARLPALDAGRFVVLFIPGTRCLNAKPRQSSRSPHRNRTGSPPHHGRCGHVLRPRQRLREEVRRRHRRPGWIQ